MKLFGKNGTYYCFHQSGETGVGMTVKEAVKECILKVALYTQILPLVNRGDEI